MSEREDTARLRESAHVDASTIAHDVQRWHCHTQLRKLTIPHGLRRATLAELRDLERLSLLGIARVEADGLLKNVGELQSAILLGAGVEPELVEIDGNMLVNGGGSCHWQLLIGNGVGTAGQTLTFFNNGNAAIGVGDSTTAAAATQTDLQSSSNKPRTGMDSTYPQHTDGTSAGSLSIIFRSTFSTGLANFAWQEWGIFNSATAATGRMLNRKVESLGTKTSASSWTLTLTLSLA